MAASGIVADRHRVVELYEALGQDDDLTAEAEFEPGDGVQVRLRHRLTPEYG